MDRKELIRRLREARRGIEPGQDVGVGSFHPEDAPGIALAYLETYGDAFPLDYVYDPEEILRRNTSGELHSLVARTPRGEVVGLCGLFRSAPNPDVCEVGQLMVLKSYRKRNVSSALAAEALDRLPRRLHMPAIFVEAVSNIVASQHLGQAQGLTCTGLEVECMPSRAYGMARNVSLVLMFKVFEKSPRAVHLPEAYRDFCAAAYAGLGLSRPVLPPAPPAGATASSRSFIPEVGLVRRTVRRCGKDFGGVIAADEATAGGRGVVQVFLNLGDAAAPQAVEALRDRGYFFSGLLPYWFGADGLLMQKTGQEPDWEAIRLCDPKLEPVRGMIREDFERARKRGRP